MKKVLMLILLAALVFSCFACGDDSAEAPAGGSSTGSGSSTGDSPAGSGDSVAPAPGGDTAPDSGSSGGERVTFGTLDPKNISNIYLATDKCFVYEGDSAFGGYGLADYDNVILAKAKYSAYQKVGDVIVLWASKEMAVYNTAGERLHLIQYTGSGRGFDANRDASDKYYFLEETDSDGKAVTTLYTYDGAEVCSFGGVLRTYPNEQGFFLATTNKSTTNAVINMNGEQVQLTAGGRKVTDFAIHQQGDIAGGAFLFGTQYARFDNITFEDGTEQNNVSGVIDINAKTVELLPSSTRLYDYSSDYVLSITTDENKNKTYGLYTEGYGELAVNISASSAIGDHGLHDAKFFSREKGLILLTLKNGYHAVIDTKGNVVVPATEGDVPFREESNYLSSNDCYTVETKAGFGVLTMSGEVKIPFGLYRGISEFIGGRAVTGGNTVINDKGEAVYTTGK